MRRFVLRKPGVDYREAGSGQPDRYSDPVAGAVALPGPLLKSNRWPRWLVMLLALVVLLAGFGLLPNSRVVQAQGDPATCTLVVTDNDVNRVSKNLYCPVCENVPLEVCPTEACQRWREQVRDLLRCGYTDAQVAEYFVARFGQKTVGTPTEPVTQVLTIGLPLALIGVFGVVVALTLIRWRRTHAVTAEAAPDSASATDDATKASLYRDQLEEELRKRY